MFQFTAEEHTTLDQLKRQYENKEITKDEYYDMTENYLSESDVPERIGEWLKDKWYIKLLRKIVNKKKG